MIQFVRLSTKQFGYVVQHLLRISVCEGVSGSAFQEPVDHAIRLDAGCPKQHEEIVGRRQANPRYRAEHSLDG